MVRSSGGDRIERDGGLSYLVIVTSLLGPQMKGEGGLLVFLHRVGLWLLTGQSWKRSQSNSKNMFALRARVRGPGAFSPPARIDEGGRKLREEAIGNQAALTLA